MRSAWKLLLFVVVVALLSALAFYKRPVWTARQFTHLQLFFSRVQSNYVLTPEGRVHYYEAESRVPGGGLPLVLVHGLADRDESWAPMLRRLKRAGFHVYAPDLLGYGRSPQPENGDYSVGGEEKFVYDFIQALGLQKTSLGGWSMGGWITLQLAIDHPELIDRVVVYDSAGLIYSPAYSWSIFHPAEGSDVQQLFSLMEPEAELLRPFLRRDLLRSLQEKQPVVDRNLQGMLSGKELLDSRLGGLSEPLLILWGSEDRLLPVALGERMHALDPKSELDILEGCGHLAPKVCSSRAAAATADFLKSNPAPSGGVRTLANMR